MSKTLGEMTPDERATTIARATQRFQAELDVTAPAIGAALETELDEIAEFHYRRPPYESKES
jgi:hypothetical protein